MHLARRQFLRLAAGAAGLPAAVRIAKAQTYPARPVRLIIGFPAGGGAEAIVEKLNREINSGLTNPNIKARLTELTTVPLVLTPEQFGSQMAAEIERPGKVVKFSGAKPN